MNSICNHKKVVLLVRSIVSRRQCIPFNANKSTSSKDTEYVDDEESDKHDISAILIEEEVDHEEVERQIELKRNKSRLLPQHRNMLLNARAYEEPQSWIHTTLRYQRSQFGRYGLASNVDPRLCFYTKKELGEREEYKKVAYPLKLDEMITINKNQKAEKVRQILARDEQMAKKLEKLDQWVEELNDKIAKKEAEAQAAKARKNRLVEEVRREFGFKLDTRDERFKEILAQKEKEDRKKQKEAKKKMKEEQMLAKLQQSAAVQANDAKAAE